jgi:hypothetical protein
MQKSLLAWSLAVATLAAGGAGADESACDWVLHDLTTRGYGDASPSAALTPAPKPTSGRREYGLDDELSIRDVKELAGYIEREGITDGSAGTFVYQLPRADSVFVIYPKNGPAWCADDLRVVQTRRSGTSRNEPITLPLPANAENLCYWDGATFSVGASYPLSLSFRVDRQDPWSRPAKLEMTVATFDDRNSTWSEPCRVVATFRSDLELNRGFGLAAEASWSAVRVVLADYEGGRLPAPNEDELAVVDRVRSNLPDGAIRLVTFGQDRLDDWDHLAEPRARRLGPDEWLVFGSASDDFGRRIDVFLANLYREKGGRLQPVTAYYVSRKQIEIVSVGR